MAGFDTQRVIAAYQAGQQLKRQKELQAQEAEDRQFTLKQREAQLRLDKINEQLTKRKLEQENAKAMEGMAAPVLGVAGPKASPMSYPGQAGQGPSLDAGRQGVPLPLPAQAISGIPELGVEGYRQPVKSMQDQLNASKERQILESQLKAQEAAMVEAAKAPFQTTQQAPGSQTIVGAGTAQQKTIPGPPKLETSANLQSKEGVLNGVRRFANFNPDTGQYIVDGKDVTATFRPTPPQEQPEAGSYLPYTDQRGQVLYWVNPKTRQVVKPAELGIDDPTFRGAMSMDRQTREGAAKSGLRAIVRFREEMKKNPSLLKQLAIPGSPGARIARAARNEMADVLTRVRTGAALNEYEQVFYGEQAPGLLDDLFDDPAAIEYKLSIFEDNFKELAPPSASTPPPAGGAGAGPKTAEEYLKSIQGTR